MRGFQPPLQVHNSEHTKLASVKQVVGHEVHAPDFVDGMCHLFGLAQLSGLVPFGPFQP